MDDVVNDISTNTPIAESNSDNNTHAASIKPASSSSGRLVSLDVLRGVDMFWIIGGTALVAQIIDYFKLSYLDWVKPHLHHVSWHGFSGHDLIFPLFIFIAGCAMPFSIGKRQARGDSNLKLFLHIAKRSALLILLGLIYNGLFKFEFETLRYPSVLGMIGLAYFWAAVVFMVFKPRGRIITAVLILMFYCLAMFLYVQYAPIVPTSKDQDATVVSKDTSQNQAERFRDKLTPGHNLVGYIDRMILPGRLYEGNFDPEGLLAMFPASVLAIIGSLAGLLLKSENKHVFNKILILTVSGLILLGLGWLWDLWFPINKKLWTSSFILYASGWSMLLLTLFYLLIDVCRLKWLFFPFILVGMNPITIYMVAHKNLIDFTYLKDFFFGGAINYAPEDVQPLLGSIGCIFLILLFLWILYKKKIFLKV